MTDKKESWVRNQQGRVVGKDTTTYKSDGSSKTTHQDAFTDLFGINHAGKITGETHNNPDGSGEYKSRS